MKRAEIEKVEHIEYKCLKELKRQKDGYMKRRKSFRVRGPKEFLKSEKRLKRQRRCRVRGQKELQKVRKD